MSKTQAELAVRALHLGTFAHLEHFKTGSYATHMALQTLYEALPGMVDSYIEQWQGKHGKIGAYPTWSPVIRPTQTMCMELADWIDDNRDELMDNDISLDNALAEIRTVLLQAVYRLKELS